MYKKNLARHFILFVGFGLMGGCASTGPDPYEEFNRPMFWFNDKVVDRFVLKPIAESYKFVTPDPVERRIGNVLDNLGEPVTSLNQLIQGKPKQAGNDMLRFLTNTTIGIGGIFDPASEWGLEKHDEDFGQTLYVWGWKDSNYLVLPFMGPMTARDGIGGIIGDVVSPDSLMSSSVGDKLSVLEAIHQRAEFLEQEEMVSGDRYTFIRDAYMQNRKYEANDGKVDVDFEF